MKQAINSDFRHLVISKRRAANILAGIFLSGPRLRLIANGDLNTTYLAESGNKKLIIRLANKRHNGEAYLPTFQRASQAAKTASAAGLPTYKTLLTGGNIVPYAYQVTEFVDGITGDKFQGSELVVWEQLGKLAKKINQIKPPGIGEEPFLDRRESWPEYINQKVTEVIGFHRRPSRALAKRGHVFKNWELDIFEKLIQPIKNLSDSQLCLTHSDLGPHNVIVDRRGKIKAILDWDHAKAFPAAHQVAVTTFWGSYEPAAAKRRHRAFLKGYGRKIDLDLVRAFQIYEFLTQLPFHTHKSAVAHTLRSVAGISKLTDSQLSAARKRAASAQQT